MQEQGEEAETISAALPRDVLEQIVSNISSARDLASVASTCKTLAEIAYLHSPQLTIRLQQQPVQWRALQGAKRSNGQPLHLTLKLFCGSGLHSEAYQWALTELGTCPEVRCLTLQFQTCFPNLRKLVFLANDTAVYWEEVEKLLHHCPGTEQVVLEGFFRGDYTWHAPSPCLANVRELSVKAVRFGCLRAILGLVHVMPGLESLSLVDRDPENPRDWECEWGEVEQWCEVLTTKTTSLKSLTFDMSTCPRDLDYFLGQVLTNCTRLTALHAPTWRAHTKVLLTRPDLQHITVSMFDDTPGFATVLPCQWHSFTMTARTFDITMFTLRDQPQVHPLIHPLKFARLPICFEDLVAMWRVSKQELPEAAPSAQPPPISPQTDAHFLAPGMAACSISSLPSTAPEGSSNRACPAAAVSSDCGTNAGAVLHTASHAQQESMYGRQAEQGEQGQQTVHVQAQQTVQVQQAAQGQRARFVAWSPADARRVARYRQAVEHWVSKCKGGVQADELWVVCGLGSAAMTPEKDWLPMFEALAPLRGCFKTLYVPSLMEWSPTVLRAIAQGFQGPGLHTLAFWDSDAIAPGFWQSLARLMHTLPELSCVQFRQVTVENFHLKDFEAMCGVVDRPLTIHIRGSIIYQDQDAQSGPVWSAACQAVSGKLRTYQFGHVTVSIGPACRHRSKESYWSEQCSCCNLYG